MKIHVQEVGSTLVREAVTDASMVVTSLLTYVEARSAFGRRRQAGDLSAAEYRHVVEEFEADWDHYVVLDVTEMLIREAARLAEIHRLRAYDAVHLASAQLAAARSEDELTLASWDIELERAAADEGVRLLRRRPG